MARIWQVYEGREPTRRGSLLADIPVSDAVSAFDLRASDFTSDLSESPRFGDITPDLWYGGFRHIVVELRPSEARQIKWRPGYYLSRVKPDEARDRLIQQALVSVLGTNNVVRVENQPTTDSLGREALRVIVVLRPGAARRLENGAPLDALVSLQKRLGDMGDQRTPLIEYATEAELADYGGS
jgi:hypothetical protein